MSRPRPVDWYFGLAEKIAERATCPRKRVGCIIVKQGRILSTGYNGSLPCLPHCDDDGCLMIDGHCQRTTHAEANAVAHAARSGVSLEGASAWITCSPCFTCLKLLIQAGIYNIYFQEFYRVEDDTWDEMKKMAVDSGVELQLRKRT